MEDLFRVTDREIIIKIRAWMTDLHLGGTQYGTILQLEDYIFRLLKIGRIDHYLLRDLRHDPGIYKVIKDNPAINALLDMPYPLRS